MKPSTKSQAASVSADTAAAVTIADKPLYNVVGRLPIESVGVGTILCPTSRAALPDGLNKEYIVYVNLDAAPGIPEGRKFQWRKAVSGFNGEVWEWTEYMSEQRGVACITAQTMIGDVQEYQCVVVADWFPIGQWVDMNGHIVPKPPEK